jgi:hypothetical protein
MASFQSYWIFRLSSSSGILGTRKHNVSETVSASIFRYGGKTPTQLDTLDKPNLYYLSTTNINKENNKDQPSVSFQNLL